MTRIVVGRGKHRQQWDISPKDYATKRNDCNALLEHVGLRDK